MLIWLKIWPNLTVGDLIWDLDPPLLEMFVRAAACIQVFVSVHGAPLFAPSTHFFPCSRPIFSPSQHSPMNIPELTSASSIRSGQGEIREQTGWEAKEGDGGVKRQKRMRQEHREPGIQTAFTVFLNWKVFGSFHLQIASEGDLDETPYYMLNVRAVSLTGC